MHQKFRRFTLLALVSALVPLASGCASGGGGDRTRADTRYVARDVNTLYNAARQRLDRGQYVQAAALFDEVERQHPYSVWARRAQLMSAFSYYAAADHTKSVDSARRFLSIHPGNRDAPYALYLVALNYYEQISDVTRDQGVTRQAMDALNEVVRRHPTTRYAADARLKLDLVRDHLAGHEMEVGRFYQNRRQWLASVVRFRGVIDNYQTTTHSPEALMRLTESYLALGIPEEARRSAAVLGANFPGTRWYERAFNLVENYRPRPAAAMQASTAAPEAVSTADPAPASSELPGTQPGDGTTGTETDPTATATPQGQR